MRLPVFLTRSALKSLPERIAQRALRYALHALTGMYIAKHCHVNFYYPGNRVLLPGRLPGLKPASRRFHFPVSPPPREKAPGRGLEIELVPARLPPFRSIIAGCLSAGQYQPAAIRPLRGIVMLAEPAHRLAKRILHGGRGSAPAHSGPWRCRNTGTAPHN